MPNRWIRESARTSKNLSEVADFSERLMWRVVTTADDFGRFLACPAIVKATCFPLMDTMKVGKVEQALQELVDNQLIVLYQVGDRRYGYFSKWIEHQGDPRSKKSKYPDPCPSFCEQMQTTANSCEQMFTDVSSKQHTRSAPDTDTVSSSSLKSPKSLKSLKRVKTKTQTPPHLHDLLSGQRVNFNIFWAAFPKKRNKGDAERVWIKLKPDEVLFLRILDKIEIAKQSTDWKKKSGQFVPYPASWLSARGWEDEYPVPPPRNGGLQL